MPALMTPTRASATLSLMAGPRSMGARLAALVAAVCGVVALSQAPGLPARACSCIEFTIESAVADGVAAFVGVARAEHGESPRGWTFDVEAVVKGDLPDQVEVWQAGRGECGPGFEIGSRVGVVVRREGDRYVTDICGGVWLADELLHPGALAAPTGHGPVALIAAGRSGPAMLASYDVDGNLAAWGLADPHDELVHLQVCPGSTTFVGIAAGDEPRLVRRDVASLAPIDAVPLPARSPGSWPAITDPRALHCTSPDGDVQLLVSASGYGDGGTENVVVWVHENAAVTYPLDHGWDLAPVGDGAFAVLLAGEDGTDVERLTLADGNRQLLARLPEGLGGRLVAADGGTGRLAIIATSNPTLHSRGDPAAPDDRLVVLNADGTTQSVRPLPSPRLAESIQWLDSEHVVIWWSLPATLIEVVALDGTVQSTTPIEPGGRLALAGGHAYAGTEDGVVETNLDGGEVRLLTPGIARVHDVIAVPDGPVAAPQPTPTVPSEPATTTPSTAPPAPTTTTTAIASADDGSGLVIVAVSAVLVVAVVSGVTMARRRQHRHGPQRVT